MIRFLFSASLLLATYSGLFAQYTKLLDFDGSARGASPLYTSLISDGTFLYGMTSDGGTANNGVVFKVKPDGTGFLKLRDFGTSPDGDRPFGSLYYDGTFLFGMTIRGGTAAAPGEGTIFKVKPDGTGYLKIYDFTAGVAGSGTDPYGALVSDGTFLYGMTSQGGANSKGTVFKVLKDGTGFVKLRDFAGGTSDGQGPFGDLLLNGSFLYGMAESGGTSGGGVIFKMQTDGTNFSLLHSFGSGTDADSPYTGFLLFDGTFLYGTALIGGTNDYGAIFKIKPDGTGYTLIHSFATNNGTPYGSLTYDGSFLYGLTSEGGPANAGTLYKIKPDGTGFVTLMNFDGTTNGSGYAGYGTPYYESGALYGMSLSGGTSNLGTIFKFSLAPTITNFSPSSGPIGTTVTITGSNFSPTPGNNIVYFGATQAPITGATTTQLTVTVPIGATYHKITATVGGLTGYSRHPFNVTFAPGGLIGACSFAPKVDFTPGSRPADIAIGDLDGDGKADVATINDLANNLSVFRNLSTTGALSLAAPLNLASGASPQNMEIGDMDGDGKLDLVAVSDGSSRVQVYRNTSSVGSLSFDPFVGFTTGSAPVCIAIGDIDGDGRMDIAVANRNSATVSIFRNTGSPGVISFAAKVDFTVGATTTGVAVGDIDGDDKPEVVSANRGGNTVSVFRNISALGTVAFQPRVDLVMAAGAGPNGVAIADLDRDGKSDISSSNYTNRTVSIFRNNSVTGTITTGSFDTRVDFVNGAVNNPNYVAVGDVSGDNKPDLIISNDNGTIVQVHKNTSTPGSITSASFAPKVDFTTGTRPHNAISGDLDGDGAPELAAANATSNTISILRNTITASPAPTFSNFSPTTGPVGTPVTITGTNFSPTPTNNTVYFNGVVAVVTTSTATTIETTVPAGATSGMITVAVGCNSVIKPEPFIVPGACLPLVERNALIALYTASNGSGWSDNSNWLSADESTWFGVTITSCHVTALHLNENNLVGPLPGALGDLVHLTELDLSFNDLTGNIPVSYANLSALEVLHLDHNQISGPIPSFLGSLSNLVSINLSVNLFDGFIPTTLGNLSNLNFLSLAVNELDGEIPPELGGLSNLEVLDLSSNLLYGLIPVELGDLSSLISLKLETNLLEGGIPPELGNIAPLLELNLEQNRLDGVIPGDLGNLTNLRVLFLGNNLLVGAVPFELGPMPALEEVSLVHNSFTSIPTFTSANIVQLAVEENFLDFGDLEPNKDVVGYTYDPQALLPPGGVVQFIVGGTVFIPFGTSGAPNTYQWFKDGGIIPGAISASYTKSGAVVGDVGLYFVHVTNSLVPNVTLVSEVFTVITDPCTGVPRTSGLLDATFDSHLDDPAGPKELGLQSTGKIIASLPSNFISPVEVEGIGRFNTDGSLDNTFNSSSDQPDEGQLLVQSDDKIVYFYASEIHRLNADGTDDAAFNANAPNYYNSTVYALAQQPDGKILIAVSEDGNLFVDRINTDGTNDATFTRPTDLDVSVIRVQGDGKILLGGYFFGGIMRLNADGSYDSPFNENSADEGILDIAVQPDGKIIAIGLFSYFNSIPHRGIVRLNSDGTIDNTFTAIGITDQIESGNHPIRVAIQGDGKIVLAGSFDTVNGADRKNLVRLNSDGTVDCPFDPGLSTDEIIDNMMLQSDGKILIAGDFIAYDGTTRNGFARVNTGGATIMITQQPADAVVCLGSNGTFTTNATGTTNITYRWQFSATGVVGTFADISDGPNYTGTATNTLVVNTTGSFGVGRYRCRINGDVAAEVNTADEGLFINPAPAVPLVTGNSACTSSALLLTATGGSAGQYRWYTVPSAGTAIAGQTNGTYTTPLLSSTTTYYVSINNGTCESIRIAVVATIGTIPAAPTVTNGTSCGPSNTVVLNAAGGSNGQYRWYSVLLGGTAIAGAVNSAFTTPALTTTTTYYVAINNGPCESSRTAVVANIVFCNQPPVIAAVSATVPVSGSTTISLLPLISDPDNNLDLSTLSILSSPASGASASIVNGVLSVNYAGISFAGSDQLTIRVCDVIGACVQRVLTIDVTGELIVYNGVSPNNDGDNDKWIIKYIDLIPDARQNKVSLFNRWGDEVFATENYDNVNRVFVGIGKNGSELSSGTYFYKIEFSSARAPLSGYITLKR